MTDLYSTHLQYLQDIFEIKGRQKYILEFGPGRFSTNLFIENGERVISIEMQSEQWYNDVVDLYKDKVNWCGYKCLGPWNFLDQVAMNETPDLSFVDGHGESRPECINLMMDLRSPIIVAHDTELEDPYNWSRVKTNNGYYKLTFNEHPNWTTLYTTDVDLFNNLKDKHKNNCFSE
jgi:hypothetical protein